MNCFTTSERSADSKVGHGSERHCPRLGLWLHYSCHDYDRTAPLYACQCNVYCTGV